MTQLNLGPDAPISKALFDEIDYKSGADPATFDLKAPGAGQHLIEEHNRKTNALIEVGTFLLQLATATDAASKQGMGISQDSFFREIKKAAKVALESASYRTRSQ